MRRLRELHSSLRPMRNVVYARLQTRKQLPVNMKMVENAIEVSQPSPLAFSKSCHYILATELLHVSCIPLEVEVWVAISHQI